MGPYFYTIVLVFLFSLLAERSSDRHNEEGVSLKNESISSKFFLFLTAAVLIFVAGCRYKVGADYGVYYKGLVIFGNKLWNSVYTFDEPGLPILASIVGLFTNDGAYFVFACSAITISLLLITIYKNERSYLLASLLFVLIGIWDGTFNGVRQYFAAAILFAGHRFIYERKLWKYLITVFLAACFHRSAVVMVVLFFLLRNRLTVRNVILLVVGTAIVSANYDTVFSFIGLLKDSDFTTLTAYATTTVNVLRILVACAPGIFCLIIYWKKELTKEQTFYINALIIHGAAMVAASSSAYLARICIYTSPFLPVAIPKLIRMDNKLLESVLRIGMVVLYAAYWYIGISGSKDLNNFRWIWER